MDLGKILEEKNISKYKLSKQSGVPYSTICDIITGKSDILKCSAETLVRISHVLGMKVEDFFADIEYPEVKKSKKETAKKEIEKSSDGKKAKTSKKDTNKSLESKKSKTTETEKATKKKDKSSEDKTKKAASKKKISEVKTDNVRSEDVSAAINGNVEEKNEALQQKTIRPDRIVLRTSDAVSYAQRKEEAYRNYCDDIQNKIKEMGELNFLVSYLKNNEVEILYNLNRKKESRYLLAIVDKLCYKYNFPLCKEYDEIRNEEE